MVLSFFVTAILSGCHTMKKIETHSLPVFDKEGHRGCRGLMPENTIPAMLKAIELGVTTLEMDVVITADKRVIVSHEPFFNHEITIKPTGEWVQESEERLLNIFNMTYAQTQKYDVGLKPHPRFPLQQKIKTTKPLLADLIDDVEAAVILERSPKVYYNIETKTQPATDGIFHPAPEEFVKLLMQVVIEKKIERRVIIQSFDFRTLQVVHKNYPNVFTAALVEDFDKRSLAEQMNTLGFTPSVYSPHYSLVTDQLIKECHALNMKVIPWTVNDKPAIDRLKEMGVDGIISDYPDLFREEKKK